MPTPTIEAVRPAQIRPTVVMPEMYDERPRLPGTFRSLSASKSPKIRSSARATPCKAGIWARIAASRPQLPRHVARSPHGVRGGDRRQRNHGGGEVVGVPDARREI